MLFALASRLEAFSGTYEGDLQVYLGCKPERDLKAGTTILSQKHFTLDILRTYGHEQHSYHTLIRAKTIVHQEKTRGIILRHGFFLTNINYFLTEHQNDGFFLPS